MTANAPSPAHTRLPAIDPSLAQPRSAVIEALNQRLAGALVLSAEMAGKDDVPAWIAFDAAGGGVLHLAPLVADSAIVALTDPAGRPDAASAAAALGAVEPVVAAIERVAGRALRPTAVGAGPLGDSVVVRIDARTHGVLAHRLLLAWPLGLQPDPIEALPPDPAAFVDVAPAWTARITGPAIAPASLARIGTGDLLLLGTGSPVARFTPPGCSTILAARLDVQGGLMAVEQELEAAEAAPPPREAAQPGLAAITVPTSIEFDGGGLTLDRLAALGRGSIVDIPGAAGGVLPVRLRAGGKAIASGELVAVGDGYGVLITSVVSAHSAEG